MVEMQANSYNIGKILAIIVTYTILCKIVLLLQKDEYLPCAALAHYPQVYNIICINKIWQFDGNYHIWQ